MEVRQDIRSIPNSAIPDAYDCIFAELNYEHEKSPSGDVFFHDELMQKFYSFYPEFICIDIQCSIPELNKSLVLFIAVDSNGHCEIISVGLVNFENGEGLGWICDMFKEHNSSWKEVRIILCDENCDKKVLKAAFPKKIIFTSFYHTMATFKNDLSNVDKVSENKDVNNAIEIFAKMIFVASESEYVELLSRMKQTSSKIFNLFKKRWHTKRDLWTLGVHTDSLIFLKAFNTYLLSIRKKVKPMVSSQETLEKFIRILHTVISKMRKEWFQQFTKMMHPPSSPYLEIDVMKKYSTFTTPFATELIYEQLKKSEKMKTPIKIEGRSYYQFNETLTSSNSCSCNFHELMKLPCCHILTVRKHQVLSQFIQSVRPSWIFENYCDKYFTLYSLHVSDLEESKAAEMRCRYEECVRLSYELWQQIFNCPTKQSQERLEIFQNIVKSLKSGFEIDIIRSENRNESLPDWMENQISSFADTFTELYGLSVDDIIESFSDLPFSADNIECIDIL